MGCAANPAPHDRRIVVARPLAPGTRRDSLRQKRGVGGGAAGSSRSHTARSQESRGVLMVTRPRSAWVRGEGPT